MVYSGKPGPNSNISLFFRPRTFEGPGDVNAMALERLYHINLKEDAFRTSMIAEFRISEN